MTAALVVAAACFAPTAIVGLARPRLLAAGDGRRLGPVLATVATIATVAAICAAAAPGAPTGIAAWDVVLRAALAAGATLVGSRINRGFVIAAAAVTLLGTGGTAEALAGAAVGIGVALAAVGVASIALDGVCAALVTQAALRLSRPAGSLWIAALAAIAFALILVPGVWTRARGASRRRRRVMVRIAVMAGGVAGLAALASGFAAVEARPSIEAGLRATRAGLISAEGGDAATASIRLARGSHAFHRARRDTDALWARPGLAIPLVAPHLRALRSMTSSGERLTTAAARLVTVADPKSLRLRAGTVDVRGIAALEAPAREALAALTAAQNAIGKARSPWLVPLVRHRLDSLRPRVERGSRGAEAALLASRVAPGLLGADGPRRYFLAIQTPSELRASGGFIGNFGEISADAGQLRLDRVGRTADLNTGGTPATRTLDAPPDFVARYSRFDPQFLWQNVTVSPDFPTVGRIIANLYPQSGGRTVDGVIAIDPIGLAGLLGVLGPVTVPEWPVPITADNAAEVLLFEQYVKLEGTARVDFLGKVATAVWQRFTTANVGVPDLARALGAAVAEKHIQLSSVRPDEEAAFVRLGVGGELKPVRGDFLAVVSQNASPSKIDWFLRRTVEDRISRNRDTGAITSTVRVDLRNLAPASGLPPYVIGSETTPPLPPGSNKLYLSIYSPLLLASATEDGREILMESELERDRHVYSVYVVVPPGGSATIELHLVGALARGAPYRLDVRSQPTAVPDTLSVWVDGRAAAPLGAALRGDTVVRVDP